MANLYFNGSDLSALGLVTPSLDGWLDLAGLQVVETQIPGRDHPEVSVLGRQYDPVKADSMLVAADHSTMLTNLRSLKQVLSPALGFKELYRTDDSTLRVLAQCRGFQVREDELPYIFRGAKFQIVWDRADAFEDRTPQTGSVSGTGGDIVVSGHLPPYPIWTCTFTSTLSSGFWFENAGVRFTFDGSCTTSDTVVIYTDLPKTTKNGVEAMNLTDPNAEFPRLAVGTNTLSKSSSSFALGYSYRRRYE